MLMTEEKILEMLSKSENTVYEYIKSQCDNGNKALKESMKNIGDKLGLSEATVHRAVRKLRKQGIIGIVPSMEKAESNEILYYGIPDPDKQVGDIFKMIGELSSSANRFETILKTKNQAIETLTLEKQTLYRQIDQLKVELKKARAAGFNKNDIISSQPLDDGTTAYIVKTN